MDLIITKQPDDESCGPTSLYAIYRYYQHEITLEEVIKTVERIPSGGTIAALLGKHALQQGYEVSLYVYNLKIFDLTWFTQKLSSQQIRDKLVAQLAYKNDVRFLEVTQAYLDFIDLGGKILQQDLTTPLLKSFFDLKIPIITGLSSTYLYGCSREYQDENSKTVYDDLKGEPCGHFVVLKGYDEKSKNIVVADPHLGSLIANSHYYKVSYHRLMNAIMLGVLTYDANLLVIQPKGAQA